MLTPGPWEAVETLNGWEIRPVDPAVESMAGQRRRIALMGPGEENADNAALIAAAPDLLEALITMHTHHTRDGTVPSTHTPGAKPDICYACAAIRKAQNKSEPTHG